MTGKSTFRDPMEWISAADRLPPTPAAVPETPPAAAAPPPPASPARGPQIPDPPPWADAHPRIVVGFTLRMPEPLHARLKWLGENTPDSMHSIVLEAIQRDVDRRLAELAPSAPPAPKAPKKRRGSPDDLQAGQG